jgi:ketosteroid isomerase-like protein
MGEHRNIGVMRDGYAAFRAGDMEKVLDFLDDDVVWHTGPVGPLTGDYKGKEQVLGFFMKLIEETGGTFKIEIHDFLANNEHGVALVTLTAERKGRRLEVDAANVMHINSAGKLTEFWGTTGDFAPIEEFWRD